MMSDEQLARFWLFGVVFWPAVSLMGRRAMRHQVAAGVVSQAEVDRFATVFAATLGGISLVCAGAYYTGGPSADRIPSLAGAVVSLGFLVWLWRFDGARRLVVFAPFVNMPLKRENVVRLVATVLASFLAAANLLSALTPTPP
jgi:hypothetical protein